MRGIVRPMTLAFTAGLLLSTTGVSSAPIPGCAGAADGGEWPMYNHDLSNSRHQPSETTIDAEEAAALSPRWILSLASASLSGSIENTPAVADGCIYIGTTGGDLVALNADTGDEVWRKKVRAGMRGSPAVANGRVYVNVNDTDEPYTAAFDQVTGDLIWETQIDDQPGSGSENSPVVFNGMVMAGVSGFLAESGVFVFGTSDSRLHFRGSWVIMRESDGHTLAKDHVISDDDFHLGFSGGGVWSTPAVDTDAGYAYVGTGNPFNAREHPNTNSIIKIDVDPARTQTFGSIVGVYHGTYDQYVDGVDYKPSCELYVDVFTCENFDLDFGASPQLFTDDDGRALVGNLQKSGVYHAALRADMSGVWETQVGGLLIVFVGNLGTGSYDGEQIVVGGSGPAFETALDPTTGALRWTQPMLDARHISPTSTANGLAYTVDSNGMLNIWDAATGEVILQRFVMDDTGSRSSSSGAGVAIARGTVFVPSGTFLVAYE